MVQPFYDGLDEITFRPFLLWYLSKCTLMLGLGAACLVRAITSASAWWWGGVVLAVLLALLLVARYHAQAVIMAGWAPSHGARADVKILCEKIVVAQRDEITFMRNWLRDRGQEVPDATSTKHKMKMDGMEHDMLMPGMLTDEEMAALDKARGPEFDRLFLIGMIKHHQGAITMVNDLFAANGSMQDDDVYKFASDVFADQSTEIERMQQMLNK